MSSIPRIILHPDLVAHLKPPHVYIAPEVERSLMNRLNHEMDLIVSLLREVGTETKLSANDIRTILSLRRFHICV